jgi:hypothetical protein
VVVELFRFEPVVEVFTLALPAFALSPPPLHAPTRPAAARRDKRAKVLRIEIPPVISVMRGDVTSHAGRCLSLRGQTKRPRANMLSACWRINWFTPPDSLFLL